MALSIRGVEGITSLKKVAMKVLANPPTILQHKYCTPWTDVCKWSSVHISPLPPRALKGVLSDYKRRPPFTTSIGLPDRIALKRKQQEEEEGSSKSNLGKGWGERNSPGLHRRCLASNCVEEPLPFIQSVRRTVTGDAPRRRRCSWKAALIHSPQLRPT